MNNESRLKQQINCWVQLLTCKKTTSWNEDKFVLHLLDIIAQVAFANNPSNCLGLVDNFVSLYQVQKLIYSFTFKNFRLFIRHGLLRQKEC